MLPPEDVTVACSLEVAELASRVEGWRRVLSGVESLTRSEPHVVVLRFGSADVVGELAALCAEEVQCCPFFSFDLSIGAGQVVLTMRVPSGAGITLDVLVGLVPDGAVQHLG